MRESIVGRQVNIASLAKVFGEQFRKEEEVWWVSMK